MKELSSKQRDELFYSLKNRFETNMNRHEHVDCKTVQDRLSSKKSGKKLWSLQQMETTGGEPDVIEQDDKTGELIFFDCSDESPKDRRSVCYDQQSRESRKTHKPVNSALEMASAMGIELLTEEQYRDLQGVCAFDLKTSSWVKTPSEIRDLGGALFCDQRYDTVFVYHNGAQSYYASRGFRGVLRI